jgi:hypothetical protein
VRGALPRGCFAWEPRSACWDTARRQRVAGLKINAIDTPIDARIDAPGMLGGPHGAPRRTTPCGWRAGAGNDARKIFHFLSRSIKTFFFSEKKKKKKKKKKKVFAGTFV